MGAVATSRLDAMTVDLACHDCRSFCRCGPTCGLRSLEKICRRSPRKTSGRFLDTHRPISSIQVLVVSPVNRSSATASHGERLRFRCLFRFARLHPRSAGVFEEHCRQSAGGPPLCVFLRCHCSLITGWEWIFIRNCVKLRTACFHRGWWCDDFRRASLGFLCV
jgi:hypothetical protein